MAINNIQSLQLSNIMIQTQKKKDPRAIKHKYQSQKSEMAEYPSRRNKNSKQAADKSQNHNSSLATQQNSKKYPKSPFVQKKKNRAVQEIEPADSQEPMPTQYIKKQALSSRFSHKKTSSMDFQTGKKHLKFGQNQLQSQRQTSHNQKITINNKLIDFLNSRNAHSQVRDYQEFQKIYVKSKQSINSNATEQKNGNFPHYTHNAKKVKTSKPRQTSTNEDFKKYKKHSPTSRQSNKLSGQSNSGEIFKDLKGEFRSMELSSNPKQRGSLRDKKLKRNSVQLKNEIDFPIPSKLNSLYSNTTSLFCSKTELQPFRGNPSYRIATEEPQNEIIEIRKFQSLALSRKKIVNEDQKQKSLIIDLSQKMFDSEEKTEDIIRNYINIKRKPVQVLPQNQSLAIQSGNSLQGQFSRVLKNMQPTQQQTKQTLCQKDKYDDVIKLISQTNSLGEEKKQLLLTKIRQILPLAKIGSKEIRRQPSIELELYNQQNMASPTSSLKSSFVQNEPIEILNIKLLDQTLRERQKYLKEKLEKEIKRLQERKQMSTEQFESQRNRLKKSINSQIKEISKTRVQLWKGFNFAKKLLENKSQNDLQKEQTLKCVSQKILCDDKLIESLKQDQIQIKDQNIKLTKNQTQKFEPFTEQVKLESAPKQKLSQFIKQELGSALFSSQPKKEQPLSVQKNEQIQTHSFRKNYIFVDSAQKVDYDFDDTSPILSSPQNYHVNLDKNLLQQLSADVLGQSSSDQNSDRILIQQLSPTSNQRNLLALSDEEKEDIVKFIFLDLCIQIQYENPVGSKLLKKIYSFIKKLKERAKRPRGFKTNPHIIKEYLKNFITFLNKNPPSLTKIHERLERQLGPTSMQILKYLHPIADINSQDNEEDMEPSVVLDIELFQTFEDQYTDKLEITHYYDEQTQEKRRIAFLRKSMHIHNEAIFDAFNEQLDKIRPYGQWGKPFEWKKVPKFQHPRTELQKNTLILRCAQSIITSAHYMCGFMIDKEQCSLKDNLIVTEEDIEKIKSNRLTRLLKDYIEELEEKLMFIDDEQLELLVGIQEFIFEKLLIEMLIFIQF